MYPNIFWAPADDNRPYREPERKSTLAAGFDFWLPEALWISPGEAVNIPLNLLCLMPPNYRATFRIRSGIGRDYKIIPISSRTIDADYPEEWVFCAYMLPHEMNEDDDRFHSFMDGGKPCYRFNAGERIGQILFDEMAPAKGATQGRDRILSKHAERGSNRASGFGSTGDQ